MASEMKDGRALERGVPEALEGEIAAKPRVLELCLALDKGGLELYVLRVATWLSDQRIEGFTVVGPGGELERRLRTLGLPYRQLKVSFRWFPLIAAYRLARWLDEEAIDVVHLHWADKELSLAVLACALARRRVRLVYTRHIALNRSKHDWYHRALYRRVDVVLAITADMQRSARRFLPLPPERVQLLYHGVPATSPVSSKCCERLRAKHNVPADAFLIGLFGRIEPPKGQHVLIDAMAQLRARGCHAHALLFGHPMKPRYLEDLHKQIARLGLEQSVRYAGFYPRPQEIMGCFDCIVLTTYNETFGLVLIEAMRAGAAVIGTDAGGVPEIIQDGKTGLLVPPGDPGRLADAIERLVREPNFRRYLAKNGKDSADTRFSEERHFAQLLVWLRGTTQ